MTSRILAAAAFLFVGLVATTGCNVGPDSGLTNDMTVGNPQGIRDPSIKPAAKPAVAPVVLNGKGGIIDDGIKPTPVVINPQGGVRDPSVKPVVLNGKVGNNDDGIKPKKP